MCARTLGAPVRAQPPRRLGFLYAFGQKGGKRITESGFHKAWTEARVDAGWPVREEPDFLSPREDPKPLQFWTTDGTLNVVFHFCSRHTRSAAVRAISDTSKSPPR